MSREPKTNGVLERLLQILERLAAAVDRQTLAVEKLTDYFCTRDATPQNLSTQRQEFDVTMKLLPPGEDWDWR